MKNLNALKASQDNDTTTKLLCKKWVFLDTSFYRVSVHVSCFSFPSVDNLINITFVWKHGARDSQENYRPALHLKYFHKTSFSLLDNLFAKYLCWLKQSFVAQHCPDIWLRNGECLIIREKYYCSYDWPI